MEKLIALRTKLDAMKAMGTNAKKDALAELNEFEQASVGMMLNSFVRFGVKKYLVAEPSLENKITDEEALQLLNDLAERKITGGAAIIAVEQAIADMTLEGQDVFRRFLIKDPKAGVGISLCNKVFRKKVPQFKVQLATDYAEKDDFFPYKPNPKAKFPLIASLKLDGMRVIGEVVVDEEEVNFLSRTGNPVTTLDHLKPALIELAKQSGHSHIYFDGEATLGAFNSSISALRKKGVEAIGAKFHIFDWFLPSWMAAPKTGVQQYLRCANLGTWFKEWRSADAYFNDIVFHPFVIVNSHDEFMDKFSEAQDADEEGYMGKDPKALYEFKRTRAWWKLKGKDTVDGEIVGFLAGDADSEFANTLGRILVKLESGQVVRASGIKHQYLDEIWNNQDKYMGRIVEVRFHEYTPDGSLRHPRLKWPECLRDSEDSVGDKQ